MSPLAGQATDQMLAGNGEQSFQVSDRLRSEMEKLFSECQGGNCPGGDELDSFLKLQRMKPGNNFAQMSRSMKFGKAGGRGRGSAQGQGQGEGTSGDSGYAVTDGSNMEVLGNESAARGNSRGKQSSRYGNGAGTLASSDSKADQPKSDAVKGLNPVNRQSGAVASEAVIEEYNDVVESYFKAITTKKKP